MRGRRKALQNGRGWGAKEGTNARHGAEEDKRDAKREWKKMKGEAYYSQTDGRLNSRRIPLGTCRDDSLHLRVTGGAVQRGAGPNLLKHGTPRVPVCKRADFCFVNLSTKRQICDVGWQEASSTRFPLSSTLTLFYSGVYPLDAVLLQRGEKGGAPHPPTPLFPTWTHAHVHVHLQNGGIIPLERNLACQLSASSLLLDQSFC